MQIVLYVAAFLILAVGVAHSWLGEQYILQRLFRRDDLPKLFGSAEFTMRTLRFAWHITTVAWWGYAAILILLANAALGARALGLVVSSTFLAHFVIALAGSRGRHLSWLVFLAIGVAVFWATQGAFTGAGVP